MKDTITGFKMLLGEWANSIPPIDLLETSATGVEGDALDILPTNIMVNYDPETTIMTFRFDNPILKEELSKSFIEGSGIILRGESNVELIYLKISKPITKLNNMSKVRIKFECDAVMKGGGGNSDTHIVFSTVASEDIPEWQLSLTIPEDSNYKTSFEEGKEYYLDFTEVTSEDAEVILNEKLESVFQGEEIVNELDEETKPVQKFKWVAGVKVLIN